MKEVKYFLIFLLIIILSITFSSATNFGYNYLDNGIGSNGTTIIINNSGSTNASEYWDTNLGSLDNANATQFTGSGGTLSILESWLTSFINALGYITDLSGFDTDDLAEGSINKYDNSSWNEAYANDLYVNIDGDNMTGNLTNSEWFNGRFNWTTDDWATFDGSLWQFNESMLSTTYYNATTLEVIAGTVVGDITVTQHQDGAYDDDILNLTEQAGSPALDIRINFTDGITSFTQGIMRFKTSSLAGDTARVQLWDYVEEEWEDYPYLIESPTFVVVEQSVFDDSSHVEDGTVQMRLYKESNGNTNNEYYIDWFAIAKGYGTPAGEEIDPYSIHKDGSVPLTANWDAGEFNITADTFNGKINSSFINVTGDLYVSGNSYLGDIQIATDSIWVDNIYSLTGDLNLNNSMYVKSDGNVGIGTDNPGTELQVNGRILIKNDTDSNNFGIGFQKLSESRLWIDSTSTTYGDSESGLRFSYGTNPGAVDLGIITTSKRFGIGTINPGYTLHVNKSIGGDSTIAYFEGWSSTSGFGRVLIATPLNNDSQLSFMEGSSTKWSIGNDGTDDSFHINNGVGAFGSDDEIIISSGIAFRGGRNLSGGNLVSNGVTSFLWGTALGGTMKATSPSSFALGYVGTGNISSTNVASLAGGYVNNAGSTIEASGEGSIAWGRGRTGGDIYSMNFGSVALGETISGTINSTNLGSFAVGSAGSGFLLSEGVGSFVSGRAETGGFVKANATGAVAQGYASAGEILAGDIGAIAMGMAYPSTKIHSTGDGAIAMGQAQTGGGIFAKQNGAIAMGRVADGYIISDGIGTMAMGYAAAGYFINSTGDGSIALGRAFSGNTISNSTGSIAFGDAVVSGADASITFGRSVTNNNANSFMVGWDSPYLHVNSTGTNSYVDIYGFDDLYVADDTFVNDDLVLGSATSATSTTIDSASGSLVFDNVGVAASDMNYIFKNTNGQSFITVYGDYATPTDVGYKFDVDGTDWAIGIDDSDSDKLKIGASHSIGTNTVLTMTTTGAIVTGTLQATDYYSGDGTQGITSSSYYLCSDSSCTSKCNVQIKDGLIVGCT